MRIGRKIYEPFQDDLKDYPFKLSVTPEAQPKVHEVHEVHEKCKDCNMYVGNSSGCKGLEDWSYDKCLKEEIHRKVGFSVGGGEQERLRIVM